MSVATEEHRFRQHLRAYDLWKTQLKRTLEGYQRWLDDHGQNGPETDLRIYEALEALKSDRLMIAFVAEFSRGKTELINAIFFADYQRRLLPSDAGRTTMCPTELFYDHAAQQPYIRLLPIETRLKDMSLVDYKREPIHWTYIPLDVNTPEQMVTALAELVKVKQVPLEHARRLGLYREDSYPRGSPGDAPPEQVEIPVWRHALISFPHPLLQQGLVILDTPGLNALGSEPELTLNMLPGAQAVLFVLAADTGVTRSDLEMWTHSTAGLRRDHPRGLVVVLNKIDTLWDELKSEAAVNATIEAQRDATARALHVGREAVFPVSAQKALLAKIRQDPKLLGKSRLQELEAYLCNEILPDKQNIVRNKIAHDIGDLLDNSRTLIVTRLAHSRAQLAELKTLGNKNAEVIQHLMRKTRQEQAAYVKSVESLQTSRRLLAQQAKRLLGILSLDALDRLTDATRRAMVGSWTTTGLKHGMKTFFDGTREVMEQASAELNQAHKLVQAIYRKFHDEHGLPALSPATFSVEGYAAALHALCQEAEDFRNSPVTAMTEQSFVIKKFFITLVSRARAILFKANQEADRWFKSVMDPLLAQIKEHKLQMEQRLETLHRISVSRDTLAAKLKELEATCADLQQEIAALDAMRDVVRQPLPFKVLSGSGPSAQPLRASR